MCNVVVAVVDDGIVVAGRVVGVVVADVEVGQLAQVAGGVVGHLDQVAAHLAEEDGAVGQYLQLVEDAHNGVDRVDGVVQVFLVGIEHIIGLLLEEVVAGNRCCGDATANETAAKCLKYLGNHNY